LLIIVFVLIAAVKANKDIYIYIYMPIEI